MKKDRVRYYSSFNDDFFTAEAKPLPKDYRWIRTDPVSRVLSALCYLSALVFGFFYAKFVLRLKIKGAKKLRQCRKTGVFLYANHTQPIGDVFDPALMAFPKRIYTVAGAANMSLPVIGRLLPYLGALPLSGTLSGVRELSLAIEKRISQNACVVIYPEAHVWEYCSFIRPFPAASFKFPVKCKKPVFCATAVYNKSKLFKRPRMTVVIDGPFYIGEEGNAKEKAENLRDKVFGCMQERSLSGDAEYIKYVRLKDG